MCAMKEVTLFSDDAKSRECAQQLGQVSLLTTFPPFHCMCHTFLYGISKLYVSTQKVRKMELLLPPLPLLFLLNEKRMKDMLCTDNEYSHVPNTFAGNYTAQSVAASKYSSVLWF